MNVDDVPDPLSDLLRDDFTVLETKAVRDLHSFINVHGRLPIIRALLQESPGANQFVAGLLRDPRVVVAPEEDEVRVDGVALAGPGVGGGAPDLLAPLVVGDHVHFVLGEVEDLLDADRRLDERCRSPGGVFGETHDKADEAVEEVRGDEVGQSFDDGTSYVGGAGDSEEG